jgi:hypothetical protein
MDYADANNLCVLKIMERELVEAEAIYKKASRIVTAG